MSDRSTKKQTTSTTTTDSSHWPEQRHELLFNAMQASSRSSTKTKPSSWVGPSHISIFIRNLKLVHLDERADWPDINLRTFSSSTQQNQRQRIKCVEWALYYLFTIWDPETANNKLRPFFPPLEPLQSLNLRAALFRALSELKKNGELGREAMLRKSMLDECKGDKFEEVLAVFSTAVVRKFLSKNGALADNAATMLSAASHLTSEKQDSLLPLVLAHRVSMSSMLSDKARLQGHYDEFSQHLDSKAMDLDSRPGRAPQMSAEAAQDSVAISRAVKGAWFGAEEWADAILQGGIQHITDNMFELPFEETWSRVNKGDVESLGYQTSRDLLVELDKRVEQQKTRLHKWRDFRKLLNKRSDPRLPERNTKGSLSSLLFRDHQTLTVATSRSSDTTDLPDQGTEYKCLVSAMNASLSDLKGDSARNHADTDSSRRQAIQREDESPTLTDSQNASVNRSSPPHSLSGAESPDTFPDREGQRMPSEEKQLPNTSDFVDSSKNDFRFEKPSLETFGRGERTERLDPVKEDAQSGYKDRRLEKPGMGSLLERTRQSMSLLPPPSTGSRQSINPNSSRQSQIFPINQFETPKKPPPKPLSGTTTPKEELFDADYASVFKSRPKIATSPVVSPMAHMQSLDNIDHTIDFNLDDMESSPLARTRV